MLKAVHMRAAGEEESDVAGPPRAHPQLQQSIGSKRRAGGSPLQWADNVELPTSSSPWPTLWDITARRARAPFVRRLQGDGANTEPHPRATILEFLLGCDADVAKH
jgi:hypothetical protein